MNGSSKGPARKSKRAARRVTLPLSEAIEEVLAKIPAPMREGGLKEAQADYALLALYEGLLALGEHFEKLEKSRPVRRSDLVFRFQVVPGVVGRAAQVEQESRTIEALLNAAIDAAGL